MKTLVILLLTFSFTLKAQENIAWNDFKESFVDIFKAFPSQFQTKSNAYALGLAVPSLAYSFDQDDRLSALFRSKEDKSAYNFMADLSIAANFPIIPFGFYAWGRSNDDEKMIKFSKEVFVATYLAAWQTIILSLAPINKRPNNNVSFWEESFRGSSSFPSGHVIPFAVVTLKALQFYGPAHAILPGIMTFMTAYQRIQEGKHYISDVVGGLFLSFFASEGTRLYSKHSQNHPFYKAIFEHEVNVSFIRNNGSPGLLASWTY
ncbi:MAG: phosphatase PAP2 family protein [Bacteriovoracaceae bacterium]